MRIAYVILAHKQPQQLRRLAARLDAPGVSFFVHVDRRVGAAAFQQFVGALESFENVRFVRRRVSRWGEFGLVRATLEGIAEALRQEPPVDYVVFLTGQDYPIKSRAFIDEFFERSRGRSFLDYDPVPSERYAEAGPRLERWYVHLLGRDFLLPDRRRGLELLRSPRRWPVFLVSCFLPRRRPPLKGYKPFTGSAYWALSRACAGYVDDFARRERSFVRHFKSVWVPDELFFQTMLLNSPFADEIDNSDLHHIRWSAGQAHPATLTAADLDEIACSPALFARKFDLEVDERVLDLIDARLLSVRLEDISQAQKE
ncbi:MAG: hypothetical protein JXA87_09575 [Thermoleophilia bacterium]|nr:hypothetical protein [Thermoleophilia bacterium]